MLLRTDSQGIVTLRLNRPGQFNALSEALLAALQAQIDALAGDASLRCVVLEASGRAFSAGHDLREMRSQPSLDYYRELFRKCGAVMQGLQALPVPVIAKVRGIATAAGCQLVASCDLAICADDARFAVSGINVGLFCATPAVALSRNVSAKRAFDMLVTGRFIDAATAADWGLVNDAVPADQLDARVAELAAEILSKSPAAIRHGKRMFYKQRQMALADAYDYAGDVMARNMMDEDAAEGIDAFLQKRAPLARPGLNGPGRIRPASRPAARRRRHHHPYRRPARIHQQAEQQQGQPEVRRSTDGGRPYRVVQGRQQHADHGGVHAGQHVAHARPPAQSVPERHRAGQQQGARQEDHRQHAETADPAHPAAGGCCAATPKNAAKENKGPGMACAAP